MSSAPPQPESAAPPARESSPAPSAAKASRFRRFLRAACASVLVLALLGAGGAWEARRRLLAWGETPFGSPERGTARFAIPPGTSFTAAAERLRAEGLVGDVRLFKAYAWLSRERPSIQAGDYAIAPPVSPEELLARLGRGAFERKLTIPEGWSARKIDAALLKGGWIAKAGEWIELAARPVGPEAIGEPLPDGVEGFCFPDTYRFERGTRPEAVRDRMLGAFARVWRELDPGRRDERSAGLTTREVVALASVVQREARMTEEMPRIASVFLNRLKIGMKLQSCATVHYALGDAWDRALTTKDLKIDSPYNTYARKGLPPGPIGNPGREAIAAVLRPADEDFLYFVYRGDGFHEFSRTFKEHGRAARKHRAADPAAALAAESAP